LEKETDLSWHEQRTGIGEGTARVLGEHGASVVLGARRTDKLMSIASEKVGRGGSVRFRSLDVANLDDMKAFADFAEAELRTWRASKSQGSGVGDHPSLNCVCHPPGLKLFDRSPAKQGLENIWEPFRGN
jgi:NAD(P)-dependent dehydrogenase (short-subunit alcohol dehydrogenase family)